MNAVKMTAKEVLAALEARHEKAGPGAWVCLREALSGWSTMSGGIDLLALGVWKTSKVGGCPGIGRGLATHPRVAYEVKVSRSDFRKELEGYEPGAAALRAYAEGSRRSYPRSAPAWPDKQADALRLTNYFVFATPKGLLTHEEVERREPWPPGSRHKGKLWLPKEAGLVEVTPGSGFCRTRKDATLTAAEDLGTHASHELMRRAFELGARKATLTDATRERVARAMHDPRGYPLLVPAEVYERVMKVLTH